jgi:hypothetical protein
MDGTRPSQIGGTPTRSSSPASTSTPPTPATASRSSNLAFAGGRRLARALRGDGRIDGYAGDPSYDEGSFAKAIADLI